MRKREATQVAAANAVVKKVPAAEEELFATDSYINKALILSDKMDIYNNGKEIVGNSKGLYGLIVDVEGISKDKIDLTGSKDDCDLHNFVKVKNSIINGWVYGKDIYEYDTARDTTFTIEDVNFRLTPTKNFDIGHFDGEMLTVCGDHSPLILYNSKYNKEEFIPLSEEVEWYRSKYLVLDEWDGWMDRIEEIIFYDDILQLKMYREYHESSADFTVEIHLKPEGSFAIIKEYVYHENQY